MADRSASSWAAYNQIDCFVATLVYDDDDDHHHECRWRYDEDEVCLHVFYVVYEWACERN